ncbi:MAG: efflux RND transporter periplasmic adaptor subunit [Candidatus Roizmanbacteria bacterium]|nr:efflux RND transporter periplasmic adaptor subunit [Candidatus Roizmanbacteria bacterium]
MIKFFKKRWYLVLIIIVIIGFIFYKNNSSKAIKNKVDSYKIKRENLKEVLSLSGEINAEEKVSLKFQTSGRLAWVGVKEDDYVKKYQVIASLDQRDLKNRLQKHLNTFTSQRLTFDQTKDDYWNKQYDLSESIRKSAERTLQDSQYDLNNAVLDVELQSLTVEYANLWTPIEGIVTRVDTPFAGVNITPSGAEFEIVNPKTIYLSVTAEQSDVVLLKKGMEGEVVFDAYPNRTFTGVIDYISFSPKKGETGTVYQVKLILDSKARELPLKLAMTGDVSFITREKPNVLSVPLKFIKKDNKGNYIIRERKGKKEKIYVKRGEEFDSKVEIKNGVEAGDIVYD